MNFHPDEARDKSVLDRFLAADFAADPAALTKYRGLQARGQKQAARISDLEEQLKKATSAAKKLEKQLGQSERRRRQIRDESADLTRRLGSAHGALEAYRKETARLKADLQRLRGSKSYRLGRRMVDPLGMRSRPPRLTPALRALPSESEPVTPSTSSSTRPAPPEFVLPTRTKLKSATTQAPADATEKPQRPAKLSEMTYEDLLTWLEQEPSPASLKAVLSRSWYHEGQFSRPAKLIEEHAQIATQLTGKDAILAQRIQGAARAREQGFPLPPRAHGPAFQPERGRIMYCAHSTPVFNTNGYSIRTHGLTTGLVQAGEDVFVVGRPGYPWDSATDTKAPERLRHTQQLDGVTYVHLPASPLSETPFSHFILEAADALVREARLHRPSLIHSASNFWTALPALIAARRLGLPLVYEVRGLWEVTEASTKPGWDHTERYAQQVRLETLVATEADAVLAITEETKSELVRRGVPAAKISLAPNAVDTANYLPLPRDDAYARKKGVHTDRPVIGFTGSMVNYEGLDLLLDAVALLAQQEEPGETARVQVVMAGSGKAQDALKAQAATLGISDRVRFLGRLPSAEIPRLLSLIDIMPLPRLSLPVTEMVSPLKPLEALSAGKALVLSDVSPHTVFAGDDQERALLFPSGDPQALAAALDALIDDPDRRAALGRAGRLWCLDQRTWTHVAGEVINTHQRARLAYNNSVVTQQSRTLGSLRVGLIADEFTTATLRESVHVTTLNRDSWRDQLAGLDLVFIESAWEGNDGQWHRGVGRYSPEEHRDLVDLLSAARELSIPSVFWNKEDPVHFNRFVATASLCDHVFTTDASRIPAYLQHGEDSILTASALPFYAQPLIHNPLPTDRPFDASVSYAGTYYGDRYAQRSRELASMLTAALPHGLTIYDRQASNPESPYHFPPRFAAHVKGSLPYTEVLKSYKSHLASINVNSVADSPSMFSRRVVEVAASGGVVISGPGRGVSETFGSAILCTGDHAEWRALFRALSSDPQARLNEAWLQLRAVLRSHTVDTALTILARTAGIPVTGPSLPTYAVILSPAGGTKEDVVDSLLTQSVLPTQAVVRSEDPSAVDRIRMAGIQVVDDPEDFEAHLVGILTEPCPRTWYEDLLLACTYGQWQGLEASSDVSLSMGDSLARPTDRPARRWDLVARPVTWKHSSLEDALTASGLTGLRLVTPLPSARPTPDLGGIEEAAGNLHAGTKVLVASHDLKFAGGLIDTLRASGAQVDLDVWDNHTQHDEQRSLELLAKADTVFCEWGLGNLEWYSRHVRPDQRLVTRVHLQELDRPYLARTEHRNVDAYIFVGELIREAAIRGHGVPRNRSLVIPNGVSVDTLALPKTEEAHRTIGMVGILPERKRLDIALDVLESLHAHGEDYRLRIKGKLPADLPWMKARPDELAYFDAQFARIDRLNAVRPGSVLLDGHGDDMAQWYQNIGIALSVSDYESFHLTIADGAASGSLPATLAWDGSDLIYPREWLSATPEQIVERIRTAPRDAETVQCVVRERFEANQIFERLATLVLG